ncbi:carbohydrate binding family 9 domain-containing protein [Roseivirga sp. 4D4]|uniref:carbohydrate binding family 9 domain-containing protein n=1 Tax=Roseivirga sp. 4D4 TaxID=1889784 RepID=UPI000AC5C54C|nr:carbohydrate binding family 9 domain-containing protein [Roseivirga sp. 4D4]
MRYRSRVLVTVCTLLLTLTVKAQVKSVKADVPPEIDGVLDDDIWKQSPQVSGFKTFVPDFGKDIPYNTIAYVAHDSENLYFAIKCFDEPNLIKTSIAARDRIRADDWICINLDTFNGGQSLLGLYVNPNGIQMDTQFAAGSEDIGVDLIWYSAAKIDNEGYSVEIKIPFKSIRYSDDDGNVEMGVIFERRISRLSTQVSSPALDPEKGFAFLTQMMPLNYSGVRKYTLLELLPAITYSNNTIQENGQDVSEDNFEPSLTAKIGLTSELVLDATINPDFSQVESDAQQVEVNQRFAVNYPERRPFFLEGSQNFNFAASSMFSPVRQVVNTRTIVSPRAATKLTGKIGDKNIISTIYALDRADRSLSDFAEDETADVGIIRYMRSFTQDSYLGFIGTHRSRNGGSNSVVGFDGQYRFNEANVISGNFLNSTTQADRNSNSTSDNSMAIRIARNTRSFSGNINIEDIAQDFQSQVGFVTRTGITRLSGSVSPKLFPKEGLVQRWDFTVYGSITKDKPSGLNESVLYGSIAANLPKNTRLSVSADRSSEIFQGVEFRDGSISLSASSQLNKRLRVSTNYDWDNGIFYQAAEQGYGKRIRNFLDYQASDKLNFQVSHNFVSLYSEATDVKYYDLHILRGRLVYQANQYLFFRAIGQYNSLSKVWSPNFLASFTYIPGTVVHLGYGTVLERTRWDGQQYVPADNYLQTFSGFFFKASYLWRL